MLSYFQADRLIKLKMIMIVFLFTLLLTGCNGSSESDNKTANTSKSVSGKAADTERPSVPSNVIATLVSTSSVNLTWSASTDNVGVASYRIYRSGRYIATVPASANPSYLDTGLTQNYYSYDIYATDTSGNDSDTSGWAIINIPQNSNTADVQKPTAPSNVTATATSQSYANISWSASSDNIGVTNYNIYKNGSLMTTIPSSGPLSLLDTGSDSGLSPNTYCYSISAIDAAGNESDQSSQACVTISSGSNSSSDTQRPTVPSNVSATKNSSSVTISWSASSDNVGVKNYKIYRNDALIYTASTSTLIGLTIADPIESLSPGTYCYTLSAVDAAGNESDKSSQACVTISSDSNSGNTTEPSGTTSAIDVTDVNISFAQQPIQAGDSVSVTINASAANSAQVYYKFYYCGNYGSADYSTTAWTTVQEYSTSNTCQYIFPDAGSYVIVARAVTDPQNEPAALPIIGGVVTVGGTQDRISFSSYGAPSPTNITAGASTVISARATSQSGSPVYYKFYYCGDYGTDAYATAPWTTVQEYSTSNTCSYTFPNAGNYVVVVRAVTDPQNEPAILPIIGGVVTVREQGTDTQPPTAPSGASSEADSSSVNLTWTASTDNIGVSGYRIYRNGILVGVSGTASFIDTGLEASTSYCYSIAAVDAGGNESEKTNLQCTSTREPEPGGSKSYSISGSAIINGSSPVSEARVELYGSSSNLIKAVDNATGTDGKYTISFDMTDENLSANPWFVVKVVKNGKSLRSVVAGFTGQTAYSGEDTNISLYSEAAMLLSEAVGDSKYAAYSLFLKNYDQCNYDTGSLASYSYPYRKTLQALAVDVDSYFSGSIAKPDTTAVRRKILTNNNVVTSSDLTPANQGITQSTLVFMSDDLSTLVSVAYNPDQAQSASSCQVKVTATGSSSGDLSLKVIDVDFGGLNLGDDASVIASAIDTDLQGSAGRAIAGKSKAGKAWSNTLRFTISDVIRFIDFNQSGFAVLNEAYAMGSFRIAFKSSFNVSGLKLVIKYEDLTDTVDSFASAHVNSISGNQIVIEDHLDQYVTATLKDKASNTDLIVLEDIVDKLAFAAPHAIVARKTVSETRADSRVSDNNFQDSNEGWKDGLGFHTNIKTYRFTDMITSRVSAGSTTTHRITDLDVLLRAGVTAGGQDVNTDWNNSEYAVSGSRGDNGRIPLILIHGWQGDYGLRSPAKLGLWENSEMEYFHNFISFYLRSRAMQQKYHVYLYHYPTYKHVYFNGRMLKELMASAPTWTDLAKGMSGGGISIVAHSMGGLVARSAIEDHNAFGTNAEKLIRLVTLDTPHHGSPLAVPNRITSGFIVDSATNKDLGTHGALDLQWDSFDGVTELGLPSARVNITKNNNENRFPQQTLEFDRYFFRKGTTTDTFNPWLRHLNDRLATSYGKYRDKYILYAAWIADDSNVDTHRNNIAMTAAASVIESSGYAAGGAEPVGSALLGNGGAGSWFNPSPHMVPSSTSYNEAYYCFPGGSIPQVIASEGQAHPMGLKFRILWDYDHETIYKGYDISSGDSYISRQHDFAANFILLPDSLEQMLMNMADEQKKTYGVYFRILSYQNPLVEDPLFVMLKKDLTDTPVITSVSPSSAIPGEEITISGTGFSSDVGEFTVSFEGETSSVNAYVVSATSTALVVEIPATAPTGEIHVRVVRDKVFSNSANITVHAIRYQDNGNGTVTDQKTRLIWKKTLEPGTYTWYQAITLGEGGWRLPNIDELISLHQSTVNRISLDLLSYESVFESDEVYGCWSSTPYDANQAWNIKFPPGGNFAMNPHRKDDNRHVRLVWGGL